VHNAAVVVDGTEVASINSGLLVYLGVAVDDTEADSRFLADKIRHLRIFPDEQKPLNRDVLEAGGQVLVVSAFTTQADARKGRRPALVHAAEPQKACELYEHCCRQLRAAGVPTQTGAFREYMIVTSANDGPICVLLDSKKTF
jgi:D-tyrosyl-tRNA(Tyr) deacylase